MCVCVYVCVCCRFPVTSYELHGVPSHRQLDCLFNNYQQRKHRTPFVIGDYQWPVDSPHKGVIMRETFPCHDVIAMAASYQVHLVRQHPPTVLAFGFVHISTGYPMSYKVGRQSNVFVYQL